MQWARQIKGKNLLDLDTEVPLCEASQGKLVSVLGLEKHAGVDHSLMHDLLELL